MEIKNKKISELEEAQDMNGFYTIGYRIINGVKTSLKFGLEKVQTAYDNMIAIKDDALAAIRDIRSIEELVETAESDRVTAEQERKTEYSGIIQSLQQTGETSSAQTALAKNATDAANAAATVANNAVAGIDAKMQTAIDALIAGAPDALDTLNELAAALGNDPNFATTVLNELSKKLNRTDIVNDLTTGGIDKPFSAEMGKSLKSLLDTHNHDGQYQPLGDDSSKVYVTTLDLSSIMIGDELKESHILELSNMLSKAAEGYIIIGNLSAESDISYKGALGIIGNSEYYTITGINGTGNRIILTADILQKMWNVSSRLDLIITDTSLIRHNRTDIIELKGENAKALRRIYDSNEKEVYSLCCFNFFDQVSVPLSFKYEEDADAGGWIYTIHFISPYNGKTYMVRIVEVFDIINRSSTFSADVPVEVNTGGGDSNRGKLVIYMVPTSSNSTITLKVPKSPRIRYCFLSLNVGWDTDSGSIEFVTSIPIIIPANNGTPYTFNGYAFNSSDLCLIYPVSITVASDKIQISILVLTGTAVCRVDKDRTLITEI